jgi:hypothetical protein
VPATKANTLTNFDWGGPTRQTHLLLQHGRLRTLTITEWERLSGFPDGWTEAPGMSESERGNTLGDCFMPNLAEWLGRRVIGVDTALPAHPTLFGEVSTIRQAAAVGDQLALFA